MLRVLSVGSGNWRLLGSGNSLGSGTPWDGQLEVIVKAAVGDRLIVRSRHLAEPDRLGEIVEVRGADGQPPYLVRWSNEESEHLVFPGPDAHVEHSSGA